MQPEQVYPVVFPDCQNIRGLCHHWVTKYYEDKPILCSAREILEMLEDKDMPQELKQHLKANTQRIGCSNPWNLVDQNRAAEIKKNRPLRKQLPHSKGRVSTHLRKIDIKELKEDIKGNIAADCWCVYARDPVTHVPIRIYFDSTNHDEEIERQINILRDRWIVADPSELLNHIENEQELCIIMGGAPFIDFYYRKMDNIYLLTTIEYM